MANMCWSTPGIVSRLLTPSIHSRWATCPSYVGKPMVQKAALKMVKKHQSSWNQSFNFVGLEAIVVRDLKTFPTNSNRALPKQEMCLASRRNVVQFLFCQLGEPSFVGILPKVETVNLLQLANTCKLTSTNATCSKISLNKTCLKDIQRHAQETTPWSHSNSWCGFPNSFATVILFLYQSYLVIQRHGN